MVGAIWLLYVPRHHSTNSSIGAAEARLRFAEVQAEAGVHFHHFASRRDSLLPEDVGSGVGWGDYDNDGDEDLYLVNFAGPFLMDEAELKQQPGNRLYRNDGDGKFTDVTREAGLGHAGWDYACLWFDYNNDSWPDLYVGNDVGTADALFLNQRDGTFTDVALLAGTFDRRASMGLAVGDVWHRGYPSHALRRQS